MVASRRRGVCSPAPLNRGAVVWIPVPRAFVVGDDPPLVVAIEIRRADWHLAVTAGDVQDVRRLRQPAHVSANGAHQRLPFFEGGPKMRDALGEIAMVEVVRLDAVADQLAE